MRNCKHTANTNTPSVSRRIFVSAAFTFYRAQAASQCHELALQINKCTISKTSLLDLCWLQAKSVFYLRFSFIGWRREKERVWVRSRCGNAKVNYSRSHSFLDEWCAPVNGWFYMRSEPGEQSYIQAKLRDVFYCGLYRTHTHRAQMCNKIIENWSTLCVVWCLAFPRHWLR